MKGNEKAEKLAKFAIKDKIKIKDYRLIIKCLTILFCTLMICTASVAYHAVTEYFNLQRDMIIEREVIETGENGIIIQGDENCNVGGDHYGKDYEN